MSHHLFQKVFRTFATNSNNGNNTAHIRCYICKKTINNN